MAIAHPRMRRTIALLAALPLAGSLAISEAMVSRVVNSMGTDTTGAKVWDAGRLLADTLRERGAEGQRVLECALRRRLRRQL